MFIFWPLNRKKLTAIFCNSSCTLKPQCNASISMSNAIRFSPKLDGGQDFKIKPLAFFKFVLAFLWLRIQHILFHHTF